VVNRIRKVPHAGFQPGEIFVKPGVFRTVKRKDVDRYSPGFEGENFVEDEGLCEYRKSATDIADAAGRTRRRESACLLIRRRVASKLDQFFAQ
jgi:hypothetical protein